MGSESIREILKGVIGKLQDGEAQNISTVWNEAAGRDTAAHTRPVSYNRGKLIINVSDSSRLYELTLKKRDLIKGINGILGKRKVKEIRFKIGEVNT